MDEGGVFLVVENLHALYIPINAYIANTRKEQINKKILTLLNESTNDRFSFLFSRGSCEEYYSTAG